MFPLFHWDGLSPQLIAFAEDNNFFFHESAKGKQRSNGTGNEKGTHICIAGFVSYLNWLNRPILFGIFCNYTQLNIKNRFATVFRAHSSFLSIAFSSNSSQIADFFLVFCCIFPWLTASSVCRGNEGTYTKIYMGRNSSVKPRRLSSRCRHFIAFLGWLLCASVMSLATQHWISFVQMYETERNYRAVGNAVDTIIQY